MTAPVSKKFDPIAAKYAIRGALLEVPFLLAGVGAYLYTDNVLWLVGGVVIGISLLMTFGIIPLVKYKRSGAAKPGSIVE